MNTTAFSYSIDELTNLQAAWESGIDPELAAPLKDKALLYDIGGHYMLTDRGRAALDTFGMYRPFIVQARSATTGWECKGNFATLEQANAHAAKLRQITHLTPRLYRVLDEDGNTHEA